MSKETIIELRDVWKTYQLGETTVNAVQNMSLKIQKGDFLALVGPSGAGKSTCMNLIGCLDIPSKGAIYLDKQNISQLEESELAQIRGKKIGFIFQQFNLINTLTAAENVALPMLFQGVDENTRKKRAEELLTLVGLGDRINHKPTELSGGQQQRVAIARSLSNDPEVILADEPTGNLDSKTGKNIIEYLKGINKKGKTLIIVTHDNDLAKQARRIVRVKDGQISSDEKRK
jgi:putative ABC transport system ATP-binding protein